jgi:hypothetical protein
MAVHKWKLPDNVAVMKELVAGFTGIVEGKMAKGVELCATYSTEGQGAFCVWKASSKAALEKAFDEFAPTLKKYTEFVPVHQSFPPTMDYVLLLWQQWVKAASK